MIVRTYARRNRCGGRGGMEMENCESDSPSSQEFHQDIYELPFSSQDSSSYYSLVDSSSDLKPSYDPRSKPPLPKNQHQYQNHHHHHHQQQQRGDKAKRPAKNPNFSSSSSWLSASATSTTSSSCAFRSPTSTLMEAQEFGEMMEHMDEVNFALDGLRPGQPLRIRHASLLSLLSISATSHHRRLLRTQGMAKTIVDAILGLSIDDSTSNLAAATLFYVLANDGQDEHLLDSPSCVRFLLKLLNSPSADTHEDKAPTFGSRLLALQRGPSKLTGYTKRIDSSSIAIISKVQEILLSCKELKPSTRQADGTHTRRPELSPKWIALLTMEKACISTVSLEDTSGTVRRVGGNFKERLRELGGLDAIFDVIASCHSVLKGWLTDILPLYGALKDDVAMESVLLLLKCLKIMENATFLSKDNQNHLLGMNAKLDSQGSSMSFVGLILSAIKILSGLSLFQSSSITRDENSNALLYGEDSKYSHSLKVQLNHHKGDQNGISSSDSVEGLCSTEDFFNVNGNKASKKRQRFYTSQSEQPTSGSTTNVECCAVVNSMTNGDSSHPIIACNGTLRSSNDGISSCGNCSKINSSGHIERSYVSGESKDETQEDIQDPFAFDEDEMEPSKWEVLSMKSSTSRTLKRMNSDREQEDRCELALVIGASDFVNEENHLFENSCSLFSDEDIDILDDCLLTAVKVLMNLTNDNPTGCRQIASCGGLNIMATLITCHFPLFDSTNCQMLENVSFSQQSSSSDYHNDKHLSDQELDFLVAILGLLVNLVEKDSQNRSQLAAATVPLSRSGADGKETHRDVISILCSIFLANQGAGEATEGGQSEWNDEDALLQGEREAEKMIVEAYAALLLAFLSTESVDIRDSIADCLPDGKLEVLIPVLERFVAFHLTLNMISPETHAAVSEVIESCRGR